MPPGVTTLGAIRTLVRQRADMVNSTFCTDAELNSFINAAYYELYDLLVQKYGDDYFATSATITTDGTNDKFNLATDFYKLLGVDLQVATNSYVTVPPFQFSDRNRYAIPNMPLLSGAATMRHRLLGSQLWLVPLPSASQTVRYWYVPRLTALANDADTVDGVSGWEEYVVVTAAIMAKDKEEGDCSVLMAEKAGLIQRIEAAAENRNAGAPQTVADVQNRNNWRRGRFWSWDY